MVNILSHTHNVFMWIVYIQYVRIKSTDAKFYVKLIDSILKKDIKRITALYFHILKLHSHEI
jgi:hypothetical protein